MAIVQAGTWAFGSSQAATGTTCTVNYTTVNLGDIVVITSSTNSTASFIASISGGGCATWTSRVAATGVSIFTGVVTSVGAVTATATFTASIASNASLGVFQFSNGTGAGTLWTPVATSSTASVASSSTMTVPSMSTTAAGQLWYGYCTPSQVGSVGATSGFTYQREGTAASPDFWSNIVAYRVLATTGAVTPPTATSSPAGTYTRAGIILSATAPPSKAPAFISSYSGMF